MESTFRQELAECEQLPAVETEAGHVRAVVFPDGTRWAPVSRGVSEVKYPDGASYWGETRGNSPDGFGLFEAEDVRVLGQFSGEELHGPGMLVGPAGTAAGTFSGT